MNKINMFLDILTRWLDILIGWTLGYFRSWASDGAGMINKDGKRFELVLTEKEHNHIDNSIY